MLRCWRANTGKGQPAILGPVAGRPYFLCLGRLCLPGQREAPLVQRGDSMALPCRGDCEAGGMIQLVFYCRVREHRLGAAARRQSLSRRSPTAPFAQGSRLCLSASDLPGAAAQFGRPATGPPLCKGGTAWRSHAGGIVKRIASFCLAVLPSAAAQYASAGILSLAECARSLGGPAPPGRAWVHDKRPSQRKAFCVRFGSIGLVLLPSAGAQFGSSVTLVGVSRWPRTKPRGTLSPAFSEDRPGERSFSPDFPGRWPASA